MATDASVVILYISSKLKCYTFEVTFPTIQFLNKTPNLQFNTRFLSELGNKKMPSSVVMNSKYQTHTENVYETLQRGK